MQTEDVKKVVEAVILAAEEPVDMQTLARVLGDDLESTVDAEAEIQKAIVQLDRECEDKGYELRRVASGYRLSVRPEYSTWIHRMKLQKPPRYSRALLETLAIIAYRQPVTRGDIEGIRGVSLSTGIVKTLLERTWIREVGRRETPGRPILYGTTDEFLNYFNLQSLTELPEADEDTNMEPLSAGDPTAA